MFVPLLSTLLPVRSVLEAQLTYGDLHEVSKVRDVSGLPLSASVWQPKFRLLAPGF